MTLCVICRGKLNPLFSLGLQPLANKYPKEKDHVTSEILRNMTALYCRECNYLNLPCDIDRSIFFEDYYYLSSVNSELVGHFENLADHIKSLGSAFVLDVGSNDGVLLGPLKARSIKCLGIDPSENVSEIANRVGLETVIGFFDQKTAAFIEKNYGQPDLICASSVFTHLDKPKDFFSTADCLLAKGGAVIIEVEYLGSIIESLAFERFYFDRPHYYSVKALSRIAEQAGFCLSHVSFINAHGGSVRAVFRRCDTTDTSFDIGRLLQSEEKSLSEELIQRKFEEFKLAGEDLLANIKGLKDEGLRVAAYGCPARFSTITNFCGIDKALIPYVIDDSPLKSGRFSPGQHIPIIPLSKPLEVDIFIVFAYEYIDSIRKKVGSTSVKYFKPIPFESI
jgi:methylation protein EvaC